MSDLYVCPQVGYVYAVDMGVVLMYHPMNADGTYEENMGKFAVVEWDELDDVTTFWAERALEVLG